MRCPQCGLVHTDSDQFCRRCQVDLRTGQPRPQETAASAAAAQPAWQQLFSLVRPLLARVQIPRRAPSRTPAAPPGSMPAPAPAAAPVRHKEAAAPSALSKLATALRQIRNPFAGLVGRMQAARSGPKTLTCIQCSGAMHIERAGSYGAGGPIALILAGVVVLGLGRWAWPLYLLGPAGVGLGVFYRRRGASFWHCRGCGYRIPREG